MGLMGLNLGLLSFTQSERDRWEQRRKKRKQERKKGERNKERGEKRKKRKKEKEKKRRGGRRPVGLDGRPGGRRYHRGRRRWRSRVMVEMGGSGDGVFMVVTNFRGWELGDGCSVDYGGDGGGIKVAGGVFGGGDDGLWWLKGGDGIWEVYWKLEWWDLGRGNWRRGDGRGLADVEEGSARSPKLGRPSTWRGGGDLRLAVKLKERKVSN